MAKAPKGGRGKSEYVSTHVRMPEALVQQCLQMRDYYWEFIANGGDPNNPPNYLAPPPLKDHEWLYSSTEELDPYSGKG